MVGHACHPSTLDAQAGGLGVEGWTELHETLSQQENTTQAATATPGLTPAFS